MFERIYGISCVENHVLAQLNQCGMDVSMLYYDSAITLHALYRSLVEDDVRPEYFDLLPRSQDTLKELGVIHLELIRDSDAEHVWHRAYTLTDNDHMLLRTAPDFVQRTLLARGFRPDHYVLAGRSGEQMELINDIPERTVRVSKEVFESCYAKDYFHLTVCRRLDTVDRERLWNNRTYRLDDLEPFRFDVDALRNMDHYGVRLRNLAGMCKLFRYRLAEYYRYFVPTDFIYDIIPLYQKYYATLEYYNLKKNVSMDCYAALLGDMIQTDYRLLKELKRRIA